MAQTSQVYITEKEAQELTGYKRTALYKFRIEGLAKWTHLIQVEKSVIIRGTY